MKISENLKENGFYSGSNRVTFEFENPEAAHLFKVWFCDCAGDQDYWRFMENVEVEEEGPITGLNFNYHTGTEVIEVKCGRLEEGG